jgi:hypothetical protein
MHRFAIILVLGALVTAPAIAQQPPGPGDPNPGPPPEVVQHMQQARSGARTQAMNALSSDHQTKINALLTRIKAGQVTDAHDAARQIDAVLTPKEAQAVLAARDKLLADLRGWRPEPGMPHNEGPGGPGPGAGFGPGGGPGPGNGFGPGGGPGPGPGPGFDGDGPPGGGRRLAGHAKRNDAGFALLMLNLDREQMHALFADSRPPR